MFILSPYDSTPSPYDNTPLPMTVIEKIDCASLNAGRVLHPGRNSRYTRDSGAVDLIPKTILINEKNSKIEDTMSTKMNTKLSTKMNTKLSTKIDTKLGIRKINAPIPTE